MTDRPAQSALRRKLVARRPGADIGRMTPLKGYRLAFARAAPETAELDIGVRQVSETRLGRDLLRDRLPENALITLIEGHGRRFGLAVFDADTVAAVIEAQTTGQVAATAPPPRAPTRTDAVLVADLVDRVHEVIEAEAADVELGRTSQGFRYATVLDTPKAVGLTLEDVSYRLYDLRVDLGGTVGRPGRIILAYPALDPVATIHTPDAWAQALERAVEPAETEVRALLARVHLPFDQLSRLKPGDQVPIPRESLVRVALVAGDGRTVARGRLGQAHGQKAIRVLGADDAGPAAPMGLPSGPIDEPDVLDLSAGTMSWDDAGPDGGSDGGMPPMPMAADGGFGGGFAMDMGGGLSAGGPDAGGDGMGDPAGSGFAMAMPFDIPDGPDAA
jgi:flagellar motor switch protein FliM